MDDEKAIAYADRFNPNGSTHVENIAGMVSLCVEDIPMADDTAEFFYGKKDRPSSPRITLIDCQLSLYPTFAPANGQLLNSSYEATGGTIPYAGIYQPLSYEQWMSFHYREHQENMDRGVVLGSASKFLFREQGPLIDDFSNYARTISKQPSTQLNHVCFMFRQLVNTKYTDFRDDKTLKRAINIVRSSSNKPILFIATHGDSWNKGDLDLDGEAYRDSDWVLTERDESEGLVSKTSKLYDDTDGYYCDSGVIEFLFAIEEKYGKDAFSLIVLGACNPAKHSLVIPLSMPILYVKGISGVGKWNKKNLHIAEA